jgi:hypothetical protein
MKALSAVVVVLVVLAGGAVGAQGGRTAGPSLLKATFGKLPIYFIENRGVYPDEVAYYIRGADKTLFFTKEGITFRLKGRDRDWVVKLEFVGANREVVPRGEDRQQAVISYFRGPEKDWKTGLKTYSTIVYRDLWPGVDLIYKGTVNKLKYEFVVKPGADPGKIRLRYRGVEALERTKSGSLAVNTPAGGFEDAPPEAWQEIGGKRVPVEMAYSMGEDGEFGFDVGDYDRTRLLVLDPAMIVYCGYIGGTSRFNGNAAAGDLGRGIAVHGGEVYIVGSTISDERTFPVRVGPDLTYNDGPSPNWINDAFVAKVNAAGTALLYCGYIGGSQLDVAWRVAVDATGSAYVVGSTMSDESTFPVTGGPDLTHNGGTDGFVAKVNPKGTGLVFCGYIGGALLDDVLDIALDVNGNAYVLGMTNSDEQTFPVRVGPDLSANGKFDGFVAKLNAQGSALVYCGYVGGTGNDSVRSIALDSTGCGYVAGYTESTDLPVTSAGRLSYHSGGMYDAFVAKVNTQGSGFAYCAYVGGAGYDDCMAVAVDPAGNAYLAGATTSTEWTFPVRVGPDLTYNGVSTMPVCDAWVGKVNPEGTALLYCGHIGGDQYEASNDIVVNTAGNAYVTGWTSSDERTFPVKVGPDLRYDGGGDAFVAEVNATGTALLYCGYVGGTGADYGMGIAVDEGGNAYVTGFTGSDERSFPVTSGPDLTHNGGWDAFVAKLAGSFLEGAGSPRPGGRVTLTLFAAGDSGFPYQLGSSFGTGPIAIDTRQLDLSPDDLLLVTVNGYWPWIFAGYRGVIDSKGQAQAAVHIPNIPALIGIRLHSAFVTLDPQAPSGIKSISNTFSFGITKQ